MREFFRGWKRKLGVVTLGLACVFAGWWIHAQSLVTNTEGIRFRFDFTSDGVDFDCTDFAYSIQSSGAGSGRMKTLARLLVPYWAIVSPLTLLSAYLLLSKPRPSKPKTAIAPITGEPNA
jgi:hypothetical protein